MHLFAYGTLMIPQVMHAVTGRTFSHAPGWLEGYERKLLKGRSYPGITLRDGRAVSGKLYLGIDSETLRKLDDFEDAFYRRERVKVRTSNREKVDAFAYVIPAGQKDLLSELDWDASRFCEVELERFLALLNRR